MILVLYGLILSIGVIAAISIVVATIRAGISPMPSSRLAVKEIMALLSPASEGKIYDLGSGWGTLLFAAAKKCPQAEIIGIENSLIPYLISQTRRILKRARNVKIIYGDLFDCDLSDADAILCYLYPRAMQALKDKFLREMKAEACVISNTFTLPAWPAERQIPLRGLLFSEVYLYKN